MNRDAVIVSLCRLPVVFWAGNVSMLALLRQSGYSELDALFEQEIEAYLRQNPDLADAWIQDTGDQRTSEGWWIAEALDNDFLDSDWVKNSSDFVRTNYLKTHTEGKWTVGHFPETTRATFDDKIKACAFLVQQRVRELGKIAGLGAR